MNVFRIGAVVLLGLTMSCSDDVVPIGTSSSGAGGGGTGGSGAGGSGAGGAGASLTCETYSPCGGDIVGSWTINDFCADWAPLDNCPTATITPDLSASGTATFNADLTYTTDVAVTGTLTAEIPASCLDQATECAQLDGDSTTCSGDVATSCTCVTTVDSSADPPETGTYATSGDELTVTPMGEAPQTSTYCVDGNTFGGQRTEDTGTTITFIATK